MAIIFSLGALIWIRAARLPEYDWNWRLLVEFVINRGQNGWEPGILGRGFFTTLRIGFWSLLVALVVGAPLGLLAFGSYGWMGWWVRIWINIIRGIPPLVFLFCVYFFAGAILPVREITDAATSLPSFWKTILSWAFAAPDQMDRMLAAVIALGFYHAAYVAEITRSGVESISRGQWDAAFALGFSPRQCLKMVILPQAARIMLPPLTGQAMTALKDSALGSLISLPDLTFQSLEAMAVSGMTFEIWISAALLYLGACAGCALTGRWLETKYSFNT